MRPHICSAPIENLTKHFQFFFFSFHDDLVPKSSRNAKKKLKKIISSTFKIQLISQTFNRLTVDILALYFSRKRKK